MNFYICSHCKNIVGKIKDAGVPLVCCGQKMDLLVANTVEAAVEKHIPVASIDANIVNVDVGSVSHPMSEEHLIEWIYLETEKGGQRKSLKAGDSPKVSFALTSDDKALRVYAYCNLHGLWSYEF